MQGKSILWSAVVLAAVGCSQAPVTDAPLEGGTQVAGQADAAAKLVKLNVPNMF